MRRRMVLLLTCAGALLSAGTASGETVMSVQKYGVTLKARDASQGLGSFMSAGSARVIGLGLDEQLALKLYALPGGNGGMLVTGDSPLIIREVVPITLTAGPYGPRLEFSSPRNLQSPAPGVISAFKNLALEIPAQAAACAGTWPARYEADYTTTFDGTIASSQTVELSGTCGDPGPVWASVRAYFDDVSPDLGREVQFATVNAKISLPSHLSQVMQAGATCSLTAVFQDELLCPQAPAPQALPVASAPPAATTGGVPSPPPEVKPLGKFIAVFGTALRRSRSRSAPLGRLRSLAGLTPIPVRSRVHVSCVRGCRRKLRKSFRWQGRPVSLDLQLLKSTVIAVGVTTPAGATRTQLYRFVPTRLGLVARGVKA